MSLLGLIPCRRAFTRLRLDYARFQLHASAPALVAARGISFRARSHVPKSTAITPTDHAAIMGGIRSAASDNGPRSVWQDLGVSSAVNERMRDQYPHIHSPTPAQKAFLLALRGDRDIFLRDGMGRGKTFVMALASVILASRSGPVLVLAPSSQLVEQIKSHLINLATDVRKVEDSVHVTTPQNLIRDERSSQTSDRWSTIMIDEPETMLAPLPSRNLPAAALKSHPFNRHPPPLATFLDRLRDSDSDSESSSRTKMVWVGAEMNSLLKRVVRQRGWTAMNALELDFGGMPSSKAKKDIEGVLGQPLSGIANEAVAKVHHRTVMIDPRDGRFEEYSHFRDRDAMLEVVGRSDLPAYRSDRPDIDQGIIEAIMSLEDRPIPTSSDGSVTTSLILPPEGYPLDLLAARIQTTAASLNSPVTCSILDPSTFSTGSSASTLLIAPRSAIAGLDLPNLGRIYLIDALDLAGLSPSQRSRGGLKRRLGWYDIVSGRLGRLGSMTEKGGGEVINLVIIGSGEEVGLDAILARRN